MAQQVLTRFQEHPDAWQRVPQILEGSSNSQTKVGLEPLVVVAAQYSLTVYRFANSGEAGRDTMEGTSNGPTTWYVMDTTASQVPT